MKHIKKYSLEEWYAKYKNDIEHACGVHFEDGFVGSFIRRRVSTIMNEINYLMKEHGNIIYIATNK